MNNNVPPQKIFSKRMQFLLFNNQSEAHNPQIHTKVQQILFLGKVAVAHCNLMLQIV
jgi:hypothetical protein